MGTQENIKGALEKSWDFIRDSSIRISFEAFKTYRITRLKFEKNGIKKTLETKFREIGEKSHDALKKGENIEDGIRELSKEVDDLYCNIEIVDQEIEKVEKEEPPIDEEKGEGQVGGHGEAPEVPLEEGKAAEPAEIPEVPEAPKPEAKKPEAKKPQKKKTAKKEEKKEEKKED